MFSATTYGMSSPAPHSLTIPPEFEAEMALAVRAVVEMLLDRVAKLEARVEELKSGRKTPQKSSLPPSTQHPHARPPRLLRILATAQLDFCAFFGWRSTVTPSRPGKGNRSDLTCCWRPTRSNFATICGWSAATSVVSKGSFARS